MAQLTLNINKWLCGEYSGERNSPIGVEYLGNKEGVLLCEDHNKEKEHSMCCIGQFLSQAGIQDEILVSNGQPGDLNSDDEVKNNVDFDKFNREITDLFFEVDSSDNYVMDTPLTEHLMEINDDAHTTVFDKIKQIREKLESKGHTLKIEDPKGELEQVKQQYIDQHLSVE